MLFNQLNCILALMLCISCSSSSKFNDHNGSPSEIDVKFVEYVKSKYGLPAFPTPPTLPNMSEENVNPHWHYKVAVEWLGVFNAAYRQVLHLGSLLDWEYNTNITEENGRRLSDFGVFRTAYMRLWRLQAGSFYTELLPPDVARQIQMIRRGLSSLTSNASRELASVRRSLQSMYNAGKVCVRNGTCWKGEPDLTRLMATSRDPEVLLWAWKAWRDVVGPPMKKPYFRFIELQNLLARSGGRSRGNMGEVWRSEMGGADEDFEAQCEHLYRQIRPLYQQLHAYVRRKLMEFYGGDVMGDSDGAIPAHVLGNMWGQEWDELMDIVRPYPDRPVLDVTAEMRRQNFTMIAMFKVAEDFFVSLGLEPMTQEFWDRSMLEKPKDESREVACHGSSSNFFDGRDYRIRMCTEVTMEDLNTVHHEMGHVEYFMQYRHQPILFQDSANSAFHEAVGDTIQYSFLTPGHLHQVGLLREPTASIKDDLNFLMKQALLKLPLIPFSLIMDKWRWELFAGKITEENVNKRWWQLRRQYQGIQPPVIRTENDFDPGAKYHIPDNTPYIRYFISSFIQVQFHRALCQEMYRSDRHTAPIHLHRCSIYGSKQAGNLLKSVLEMGCSRPWKEAMVALTGQSEISAHAILEYYEPLYQWLYNENHKTGTTVGW